MKGIRIGAIAFTILVQTVAVANEKLPKPYGGIISDKNQPSVQIYLECRGTKNKKKRKVCSKSQAIKLVYGEVTRGRVFNEHGKDITEAKSDANYHEKDRIKEGYISAGFIGVGVGAIGGVIAGLGRPSQQGQYEAVGIGLLFGGAFDLVKAPFVLGTYGVHRFIQKRRVKRAFKHIKSRKKRSKDRAVKHRTFQSIQKALFL